jgi:hypothetical protein
MRTRTAHEDPADAVLSPGEGDAAFAAWTLEELAEDLGPYTRDLGPFAGSDDPGS